MKKYLSTENIIRAVIVVVLIGFASLKYDIKNIILGLLIIFGMTVFGVSFVSLYQEVTNYISSGKWDLSIVKSILLVSLAIVLPVIFLLMLSPTIKIYVFVIVGVVLAVLLVYDILRRILRKTRH